MIACLNRNRPHLTLQVTEKCPECGHMEAYSKEAQVPLPHLFSACPSTTPNNHFTPAPERGRGFDHLLHCTSLHNILEGWLTSCLVSRSASSANLAGASTTSRTRRVRPACSRIPIQTAGSEGYAAARRGEWYCYTYTPTEQKRATTPNPPRRLAVDATASSRTGIFSFGRLGRTGASVSGCGWDGTQGQGHTWKSRKQGQR